MSIFKIILRKLSVAFLCLCFLITNTLAIGGGTPITGSGGGGSAGDSISGVESIWKLASTVVSLAVGTWSLSVPATLLTGILDMNGNKIDLDVDADTSITADTDDQIDIEISGAKDFQFTANLFSALSGSIFTSDDLDSTTAATLLLGKSTATKVEIADTGIDTNIQGTLDVDETATFGADVLSDTAATDNLGSEAIYWLKGFFGSELSFEGATDNDFQTTISFTDPTTPDKTITFQDATGIVAMDTTAVTDLEGTALSITAGTLNVTEADPLSATKALDNLASVAISESLVSDTAATDDLGTEALYWNKLYNGEAISFEGATDNDYQTTFSVVDPTADNTISFPDRTGTMALHFDPVSVSTSTDPALPFKIYYIDASGGDVTMTLPDISAAVDGQIFRFVLAENTHNAIITTSTGTDLIGDKTSQSITEEGKAITVQANNTGSKYEVIQDSRFGVPLGAITYYGVTEASAVGSYDRLVTSTADSDFSTTPTDVSSGAITGSDQLIGSWISDEDTLDGITSEQNLEFLFKIRKTAGNSNANFYVEIYNRDADTTETLLGTSGTTAKISSASYAERSVNAVMASSNWETDDRLLIKFYGSKVGVSTDPTFDIELEGLTPARANFAVSTGTIVTLHNGLSGLDGGTTGEYYHLTSAQHTIATQAADTTLSGYLSTTDWDTFNNKAEADQTMYIGTTAVNINRATAALSLAGVDIDGSAGTATTATNLAGGSGGTIPYQSAAGTTAMLANGTAGKYLQSNGTTVAPSWETISAGDVTKVGTPVNNQIGIWTGNGTLEGDTDVRWDDTTLTVVSNDFQFGNNGSANDTVLTFLSSGNDGTITFDQTDNEFDFGSSLLTTSGNFSIGTSSAATVGTIELGAAADTTISRTGAGAIAVEGVAIPTISSTSTLTNKRITKRVCTTTDDATAEINIDNCDEYELTAVANATTFTLTGTPTDGQPLIVRFKDAGVSKGLTWTGFTAVGITLPTDTTAGKWEYVGCKYNLAATAWHCIADALQE